MFKKFMDDMNKPITWGGYAKLCIVCLIASCVYGVVYCYMLIDGFRDFVNQFFAKLMFWKKKDEESFEDEL